MRRWFLFAGFTGLGLLLVLGSDEPAAFGQKAKSNDGVVVNWGKPKDFEIGKATAWERALQGLKPDEMAGFHGATAATLNALVARLGRR